MFRWMLVRNVKCRSLKISHPPLSVTDAALFGAHIQHVKDCLKAVVICSNDCAVTVALEFLIACTCCLTDIEPKASYPVSDADVSLILTASASVLARLCAHLSGEWKPRLAKGASLPVNIECDEDLEILCAAAPHVKVLGLTNPLCTPAGFAAVAVMVGMS